MSVEKRIDDLINAGWHVLDTDFDAVAFHQWRKLASECLDSLLGPDHAYAQFFKNCVQDQDRQTLLAGGGILSAAKQTLAAEAFGFGEESSDSSFHARAER